MRTTKNKKKFAQLSDFSDERKNGDNDEDEEEEILPPHEIVAMKLKSTSSVVDGVGKWACFDGGRIKRSSEIGIRSGGVKAFRGVVSSSLGFIKSLKYYGKGRLYDGISSPASKNQREFEKKEEDEGQPGSEWTEVGMNDREKERKKISL